MEKSVITVVVGRLTKYAHFCVISHIFKTSTITTAFMETIQNVHGNSKVIVSDRDPILTRTFWTKLFYCLTTQPDHTSSDQPQSDGKTDIMKKSFEIYLCFLYLIKKPNGSN